MKRLRDYDPALQEAWATFEVFRKLGFKSDDIFWVFEHTENAIPKPGITLNIVLKTQARTLTVTCSRSMTHEKATRLHERATKLMELVNDAAFEETEMTSVLLASRAWTQRSDLLLTLKIKGFDFPFQLS